MGSPLQDLKSAILAESWEGASLAYTALTGETLKPKKGATKKKVATKKATKKSTKKQTIVTPDDENWTDGLPESVVTAVNAGVAQAEARQFVKGPTLEELQTDAEDEEDFEDDEEEEEVYTPPPKPAKKKVAKPTTRRGMGGMRAPINGGQMKAVDYKDVRREDPRVAKVLYSAPPVERRDPVQFIEMVCSGCHQTFEVPPILAIKPQSGKYWRCNSCSVGH